MFRISVVFSLFFVACQGIFAQVELSGKVINDLNGEPVFRASVYINNTTIGTVTNEKGEYVLKGITPGKYEIVVSHVGFEMIVYQIIAGKDPMAITFRPVPKVKEMRDILVVTSSQRKKWLEILRINFLGQTSAAEKSRILNEDDIFFVRTGSKEMIKAYSELPLVIENRELGYRVYFELQEFFYDAAVGQTTFYGYSRYEELKDSPGEPAKKYLRARARNYTGSTLHFYQSLLAGQTEQQGFSMYVTRRVPPVDSIPRSARGNDQRSDTPKDARSPTLAFKVGPQDILFKDSARNMMYLRWEGVLSVRFKDDPYYKASLSRNVMLQGNLPRGFQSNIMMVRSPAYIDENGTFADPLSVQYSGFWMYEKLANMMPINYRPD